MHCGECGSWNKTPHPVVLAWLGDVLDILTEGGIGYALWNFRGDLGILDTGREDVAYREWHGHKLDGKLLGMFPVRQERLIKKIRNLPGCSFAQIGLSSA